MSQIREIAKQGGFTLSFDAQARAAQPYTGPKHVTPLSDAYPKYNPAYPKYNPQSNAASSPAQPQPIPDLPVFRILDSKPLPMFNGQPAVNEFAGASMTGKPSPATSAPQQQTTAQTPMQDASQVQTRDVGTVPTEQRPGCNHGVGWHQSEHDARAL